MVSPQAQDPVSALLAEFSTRLNEIEEKQRLIKDRILLIGENLISAKEDLLKLESEYKRSIKQLDYELSSLRQLTERILNEIPSLAKKSEIDILERQANMFQPLEFVKAKELKGMIREEIKRLKKEKD